MKKKQKKITKKELFAFIHGIIDGHKRMRKGYIADHASEMRKIVYSTYVAVAIMGIVAHEKRINNYPELKVIVDKFLKRVKREKKY